MSTPCVLDLAAVRPVIGGWLATASAQALRVFRDAGFDYVGVDMQHGTSTPDDVRELLLSLRDSDFPVIVRVPSNDYAHIGKVLDLGASGVIVPMVDDRSQAEAAVAACRFPPQGSRSFGPIRGDVAGATIPDLNARGRCYVQIETTTGMANAAEIVATPGLSGIYVGPGDLSISLGMEPMPGFTSTQLQGQFEQLRSICEAASVVFGAHAIDVESTRRWIEWGVRLVSATNDVALLSSAARATASALGITSESALEPAY